MSKTEIIEKLKELGILSTNCYPKKSFVYNEIPSIGCYSREMSDDFYFFNAFDDKLYVITKELLINERFEKDTSTEKYIIPMSKCRVVWEDKPFEEIPDLPFKEMSLRQYACIHMRIPDSGLVWLDNIIIKAK